jgi:glycosyltransferase involved in cell wall biosynthesis
MAPRVTVIIPTFNYAQVLPYSIGSVLRQTFQDFELLVIGDHCTDDSESVVGAIGDPRVRWINLSKNVGHQSGPNNEGLRQARGDIVAYLGHDDLWLPRHLELAVADIDGGADLSYGLTEMVPPGDGAPWFAPYELEFTPGIWIPPTAVAHRREIALRVGGWKHFAEVPDRDPETDLWLRIHQAGGRVKLCRRLTAVKFPAARRKGVYASKPSHEQQTWSARINTEADFAEKETARLLVPSSANGHSFVDSARAFGADTWRRIRRRLWWLGLSANPPKRSRAEIYEERLRFKGIK